MQVGVWRCAVKSSWFKTYVAVLTSVCVTWPVVNQQALSLYIDASFLATPPHTWKLDLAKCSAQFPLSAESFQLLLLLLTASAGSWKEWQIPFLSSEEASVILLLCRNSVYRLHYGKLLDPEICIERHMHFCLIFAYIYIHSGKRH